MKPDDWFRHVLLGKVQLRYGVMVLQDNENKLKQIWRTKTRGVPGSSTCLEFKAGVELHNTEKVIPAFFPRIKQALKKILESFSFENKNRAFKKCAM